MDKYSNDSESEEGNTQPYNNMNMTLGARDGDVVDNEEIKVEFVIKSPPAINQQTINMADEEIIEDN